MVPRRFFFDADYALPIGRGHRLLGNTSGIPQQLFGGWRTTWTGTLESGQYFTPSFSGFDPSGTGTFGGVPDRIDNGNLSSGRSVHHWFDNTAFAIPGCPATTPVCTSSNWVQPGRFGNSGFNILAGPPLRGFDFELAKEFKVWESKQLRFAVEANNAFNHPAFSTPSANISAPTTVGTIGGTGRVLIGDSAFREIDFILRLIF